MRRRHTGALVLMALLVAAAPAPALAPEDILLYLDEEGRLDVGLVATGLEGISRATHGFSTDDCRRSVRIHLDYAPQNASVDGSVAYVATRYEIEGRLLDATGAELLRYTWRGPGAIRHELDAPADLRLELTLLRGAAVDYRVRATGWVDPDAECALRQQILVTEVEANPEGTDAGREWIEISNLGFQDIDLAGWRITTTHGVVRAHTFPEATPLAMGQRLVLSLPEQFLDNEDESVRLHAPRGWLIDATPPLDDAANDGRTWQREGEWTDTWGFRTGTPGSPNG